MTTHNLSTSPSPFLAFALLKPDVVIRKLLPSVLDLLANNNFNIVRYRIGLLTHEMFDVIYGRHFRWDLDDWRHNRDAYRFGPAIGLLLQYQGDLSGTSTAQNIFNSRKGSAIPSEHIDSTTVRSICGATDRVFNILHSSEDSATAAGELALWFGEPSVSMWRTASDQGIAQLQTVDQELNDHGYNIGQTLRGSSIYLAIKIRLLHALESQLAGSSSCKEIADLRALYKSVPIQQSETDRFSPDVKGLFLRQERLLGNALLNSSYERAQMYKRLIDLMHQLEDSSENNSRHLNFFWHLVGSFRVFVSDLERYVVTTSMIYPSVSRHHLPKQN